MLDGIALRDFIYHTQRPKWQNKKERQTDRIHDYACRDDDHDHGGDHEIHDCDRDHGLLPFLQHQQHFQFWKGI